MNYVDQLWVYVCERVLQKTISIHATTFCSSLDRNVYCSSIIIHGDKVKVQGTIVTRTIMNKSKFSGVELFLKHADIGEIGKLNILKKFADNYVDSILTGRPNYDIEENYDYHAR